LTARVVPDYHALAPLLELERQAGRRVALANGCFDVLHVGHVRLLAEAMEHADVLVVALNDDESVRSNKGDRFVTSFGEANAESLLRALRPDVHIKGTDWTAETVPERDVVLAYGGRIEICGDAKTRSSTALIEKLGGGS
jgi:cytidyltransferase-like protein